MRSFGTLQWMRIRFSMLIATFILALGIAAAQEDSIPTPIAPSTKAEPEIASASPIFFWFTPKVGRYGKALGGGASLQMASARGWSVGAEFDVAEEFCMFCRHRPETFNAGAFLLGYRKPDGPVTLSIAAGPSWGWAEFNKPGAQPIYDSTCEWMCSPTLPENEMIRGFGFQAQTSFAVSSRYIGLGAQLHLAVIEDNSVVGAALIVPMGKLR